MPRINSANPDFGPLEVPSDRPNYTHGLAKRQSFIPVAFQITSPFSSRRVLLPHALVMHVNPQTWSETHTKKIERFQTRGGFVEQHWGDELSEISADGSTGAFMNIYTGLTSVLRQRTIAWDRYRDLHDLYRNNGSLHDPFGNIVLQGDVMIMYDRATYIGFFDKFSVEETDDQPFAFKISWTFKVRQELMKIPNLVTDPSQRGKLNSNALVRSPQFQLRNSIKTKSTPTQPTQSAQTAQAQAALAQSAANQANTVGTPGGSVQLGSGLTTPGII